MDHQQQWEGGQFDDNPQRHRKPMKSKVVTPKTQLNQQKDLHRQRVHEWLGMSKWKSLKEKIVTAKVCVCMCV